jgi:chemotaxis methyl-accepting protein methylase
MLRLPQSTPGGKTEGERLALTNKSSPTHEGKGSQSGVPIVVGIGASAGGLEALDLFLRNVPADSGLAFVIVQHLDPTQKSSMVELLQRATSMKVLQVKDRTPVQPACVYLIPPNKQMSILHGCLHLLDRVATHGLHLPIDYFFRSLADDQQECSIGVVLSGMGSDGTLGLRAIKEKGGLTLVQEPASAKCDSMPKSALDAGLADFVAPLEALPGKISDYLEHASLIAKSIENHVDKAESAFQKILILLREQTGHDFSLYKNLPVSRRIERRMGVHQIDKIVTYVRFLQDNPQELALLFKELLIGVTSFFRDSAPWEKLKTEVIPAILKDRTLSRTLRAWMIGCSTGEEAYSLAIVFKEALEQFKPAQSFSLQIFATDLDGDAIEKARAAVYPPNIAADVSPERLSAFFIKVEHGYQITKTIREMVIFASQNVILDPPFTKMDFVSCRNLLIYLSSELQKRLLPVFHYSLNPGGVLLLGSSETIGEFTDYFSPLDDKARLYRRNDFHVETRPVVFPPAFPPGVKTPLSAKASKPALNLQSLADQLLLQKYSPAAVLVNDKGDILYISGRTGKYLEPAAGKVNWNIFVMAREGLRYELNHLFQKALQQKDAVTLKNVAVRTDGEMQTVDITVQAMVEPEALKGSVMIVLKDVEAPPEAKVSDKDKWSSPGTVLSKMEQELQQAQQEVRIARDEMQIFREEAKSANEEMQSMNEEMQSTNEELQSTNEEMQSTNDEMQTLNHELNAKVGDLSRANNDMKNLLDSTELTTLFLDKALNVRLFTTGSNKVFRLRRGDVGRPITDIASDLFYSELADDAREVLRTLLAHEKEVTTRDGRCFLMRIMPYRTLENTIEGVVITFVDVTVSKTVEEELRKTQMGLHKQISEQAMKLEQREPPKREVKQTLRSGQRKATSPRK